MIIPNTRQLTHIMGRSLWARACRHVEGKWECANVYEHAKLNFVCIHVYAIQCYQYPYMEYLQFGSIFDNFNVTLNSTVQHICDIHILVCVTW